MPWLKQLSLLFRRTIHFSISSLNFRLGMISWTRKRIKVWTLEQMQHQSVVLKKLSIDSLSTLRRRERQDTRRNINLQRHHPTFLTSRRSSSLIAMGQQSKKRVKPNSTNKHLMQKFTKTIAIFQMMNRWLTME